MENKVKEFLNDVFGEVRAFEEDGQIVLVDYKTDAVKTPEELISRYATQVEYYKEALEKLTGKRVKETILYSFALNKLVSI